MPRTADAKTCQTCRRRKIKCDLSLPKCQNCTRSGKYCDRSTRLTIKQVHPGPSTEFNPRQALRDPQIAQLFHIYLQDLAQWYDLNDLDRVFAHNAAKLALDHALLFSAIIAFAAIYANKTKRYTQDVAEQYHARCLEKLIALTPQDTSATDGTALASTCLLRSYELLAEDVDPNRHLFGASTLVPAVPSLQDHHDLTAAAFWNYLREDITFSLIHRCPLKLDLPATSTNAARDDERANAITLLLGRTVNAYFRDRCPDTGPEIEGWFRAFQPEVYSRIEQEQDAFPLVRMLHDCHVAAMHYYHVAVCMLDPTRRCDAAVEICALAMSAESDAVLVNAYGPICFAARWLTDERQRGELVEFLRASGKRTAWPVEPIVRDLLASWSGE